MQLSEQKQAHIRNLNNNKIDYSVLGKLEDSGFKDSFWLANKEFSSSVPTLKDGNGKLKSSKKAVGKRIDFLWCNDVAAKKVKKSIILKNNLTDHISDHYPVYVELEL